MLGVLGSWANLMNLMALFPPLYIKGNPDWRKTWQNRLDEGIPLIFDPGENLTDSIYWKELQVAVEDITVPTFLLEGWRGFSYRNGFELYRRLRVPKKMIVGPWVHIRPNLASVEPIDHMREVVRWFDHWLKGTANDVDSEPPLSVYVMGEGRWKEEQDWPPVPASNEVYYLGTDASLSSREEKKSSTLNYRHDPGVGTKAGLMSLFSLGIDYPDDQAEDDARSLRFDSEPLLVAVEIVGDPSVEVTASTDMPDAYLTAKLCDVDEHGKSTLVTQGWLRLSRREGLDRLSPVDPGVKYSVAIKMWPADYLVAKGHKIRLSLSLSDFPHVFPLPYEGGIQLHFGRNCLERLHLSALQGGLIGKEPSFASSEISVLGELSRPNARWQVHRDTSTDMVTVRAGFIMTLPLPYLRPLLKINHYFEASLAEGRPRTAVLDARATATFGLDGHKYFAEARELVNASRAEVSVRVTEDGKDICARTVSGDLNWV